jgi:colanic acid/amylovoran biosynthesis glycosyltransferase
MIIAYLVNQYPKVSHSFVRREVVAVETCGMKVARFSIRSCESELVDGADKLEQELTKVILGVGVKGLVLALLRVALTKPAKFLEALQLTFKVGWHSDRGIILHLAYLAEACVLLNLFAEQGIAHVHAHFGTNSTTVAMLCRVLGGPTYSFTVHGPEEFDKATLLALEEKIKRSHFVAAVSSFGKSQIFRWCDRTFWSKIHVIHCGVDAAFLAHPHVPIPATPRLVCIGRLSEQKGHLLLLEAANLLAVEGLDFKLVFVGDGPLRSDIEKQIAQFNLQKHIEITGWASSDQVREQLLASRAMVLPSFAEGLPVVIMEALALNRPVISTYVAGIPELVEPGVCGWLVPPGSAETLAIAMRAALEAPLEQLEEMGRAGAERVAQQHNVDLEAKKLVALFESSIER